MTDKDISRREKLRAIGDIAAYKPTFTAFIVVAGILAAALDAVGLSFLLPIVEIAQTSGDPAAEADGAVAVFVTVYQTLGIPFTLEFVILGVAAALTSRYGMSFVVGWLRAKLSMQYTRELRERSFDNALDAEIAYYDKEGSDDILNAIITQTQYAGRTIRRLVRVFELSLLCLVYVVIAVYISPVMSLLAAALLGGITVFLRYFIEPGYAVGDRVAEANERVQEAAQAGTQGIRDVKLFGMADRLRSQFRESVRQHEQSSVIQTRNKVAMNKFYNLASAITVFVLIYVALRFSSLSLGALAVFLFAMFLLAPRLSNLNSEFYQLEADLPHFVRTEAFINELDAYDEHDRGSALPPERIESIAFEDVTFSYRTGEQVLRGVSFDVERGEFVAFVGQSGAGKSTIVSLLARMYGADSGEIRANGQPIREFDLREWRSKLAVVRQDPFVFNDTLRFNLTIGREEISEAELDRVCEITQVTEFMDDLTQGYDTQLGDDGVKLSGGQRQRVALARALLKDAEILILDEATSDLDSNLEGKVHRAIEAMDRNHTIFGIAHRLSTVQNADTIYTVEGGRITEQGTHSELLENDGKYAQLYRTQVEA
jgi:subfamily B ATP-binding cassette protein MsbA